MPVTLPGLPESIGYGVSALLGIILTWYFGQFLVKWFQAYRNRQQTSELEEIRKKLAEDTRTGKFGVRSVEGNRREMTSNGYDPFYGTSKTR
jgi:hypothetical protein